MPAPTPDPPVDPLVVVIGGANVDVLARSSAAPVPGTSNPGTTLVGQGGVGRNVAENLARLGTRVELVSVVGPDRHGDILLDRTAGAGVGVGHVHRGDRPTGTYTAVLDDAGELVVAVADMAATDLLDADVVAGVAELIARADLVVLDGNLHPDTVAAAAALSERVVLEPVSVPKARRLAPLLDRHRPWFALTPNRDELAALTDSPVDDDASLDAAVDTLHALGVEHVWVRLGHDGSLLSSSPGDRHRLPVVPADVVDVTGAGDAMLAAFCHALLAGRSPVEAAAFGHGAAALTVADPHPVRPDLSVALVEQAISPRSTR